MTRMTALATLLLALMTPLAVQADRTDLHADADLVQPLMAGMKAPVFEVRDVHGNPVRFSPEEVDRPVVMTFFRGGWCPYCNLHLAEMRHAEEELKALGFDVWFLSADQPGVLTDSLDEPDIGYTLLSDARLDAARHFGIAFKMDEPTVTRYRESHGIDLEAASGESHHGLPVPATFLVGDDGVISFAYVNPNYNTRLHPDVLLAAARAYKADADQRIVRERRRQREASN